MRNLAIALLALVLATPACADTIKVEHAWVRATAPGQQVAGGFMDLTAEADMAIVGGSSPVSKTLELHIMRMDKGVMEMRQVDQIALPKGETVQLAPGGLHVMFIDIKAPLREGERVPITLIAKDKHGKKHTLSIEAEVRKSAMMDHH